MELGGAIGPKQSTLIARTIEDALEKAVREQGDSVALVKASLEALNAVAVQMSAIADQQLAASHHLATAAQSLAARTVMPAPVVNVTVPEAPEQETPEVTVNVPEPVVNVTFAPPAEAPEVERGVRKTVHRDPVTKLIDYITEEPI